MDIEKLRQWIGREQTGVERVTPGLVQRFNATFDLDGGLSDGDAVPPLLHFCLAQTAAPAAGLSPDGHPMLGTFLPPVSLPRRMWAGGAIIFHDDIRIGETVTRTSTIQEVQFKEGRTGELCFVTVIHALACDGRQILTERQDIVYRGAEGGGAPSRAPEASPAGAHCQVMTPASPLLFRYSALTFNAHRIHYDRAFATEVEGYPGLVVHGPLQATLLCLMARDLKGARPASFAFRSKSPIYDTLDFTLNADDEGDGLRLWTAGEGGPVAMEAQAQW